MSATQHTVVSIPLNQLVLSSHNTRHGDTNTDSLSALASSLRMRGQIHNLVVHPISGGKRATQFGVADGGRRLRAFQELAKSKAVPSDHPILCRVIEEKEAVATSLTANVMREDMHAVDEYIAIDALLKTNHSVEEIAAELHVTPLVVQRRLKLANVAPNFLSMYRADEITLDCLMALAITDDHERQLKAWNSLPQYSRHPSSIRAALTENELSTRDPRARFVGIKAYEKAGGVVRRDLFSDSVNEGYFTDATLLTQLAQAKLDKLRDTLLAEGNVWAEAHIDWTAAQQREYTTIPTVERKLNAAEAKRKAAFEAKLAKLADQLADTDEDDAKFDELQERLDGLEEEHESFIESLQVSAPECDDMRGAVVTIGRDGKAEYHRNLIRPEDRSKLKKLVKGGESHSSEAAANVTEDSNKVSGSLSTLLTSHLTQATQATLFTDHHVALAALAERLWLGVLNTGVPGGSSAMRVRNELAAFDTQFDRSASDAGRVLADAVTRWQTRLPEDSCFATLLSFSQDELIELLSLCSALSLSTVSSFSHVTDHFKEIAKATKTNVASWWKPTATNFFQYVNKGKIAEALTDAGHPEIASSIATMKKNDAATTAEAALSTSGWLPPLLRL